MKEPATRVVRTSHSAPPTRVVRATHYASKVQYRGRRKPRWFRRLFALAVILVGAGWTFQQVNSSGAHMEADLLRRMLGVGTTARLEAAYRDVLSEVHAVRSHLLGEHPHTFPTVAAALPMTVHHGIGARAITPHAAAGSAVSAATEGIRVRKTPAAPAAVHVAPPVAVRVAAPSLPLALQHLPATKSLYNDYQVYETWNNCGPASLSMALSYFGIQESQQVLGNELRPYQNAQGDNDDKDVTLDELAIEARKFGLLAFHRPNGNIQLLKRFTAAGLPVIAETVMTKGDDIGHYRVVKGYDNNAGVIVQDDSMQGHNVRFSYSDFDYMWKKYNYEYLVLVPKAKQRLAEAILGKDLNARTAWQETVKMDQSLLAQNPNDVDSRFNLSVADYYVGNYQGSVKEFEKVQYQLPFRTLWYQIEPIEAYYALGDYQKVFSLTATILNNGNRAFSQLYILRGDIDLKQGNIQAARTEFENAVFYNIHLKAAQDALKSVSQ